MVLVFGMFVNIVYISIYVCKEFLIFMTVFSIFLSLILDLHYIPPWVFCKYDPPFSFRDSSVLSSWDSYNCDIIIVG